MFRGDASSWAPMLSTLTLCGIGFVISLCLVLSLIPLYLNDRALPRSDTIYPVYTLNQLSFTFANNTGKQFRTARDVNPSSFYLPTQNMTASIQQQLNNLVSPIGAGVIVSQASMSSTGPVSLVLKFYFRNGCFACRSREQKLIKAIFKKGLTINIYAEYYPSCALDAIVVGTTPLILDADIPESGGLSSPRALSIGSLVEQGDPCPNRPALVYPTDCNPTQATGTVMTATVLNGTFEYYCYYFVTPAYATSIQLEFNFFTSLGLNYALLNDVTLNSTSNLIQNGDFEIYNTTMNPDQYDYPPWTVSTCPMNCVTNVNTQLGPVNLNPVGFVSSGVSTQLSQTVAINTVGQHFVYSLGFWFQCVSNFNPTDACVFSVSLVTT